MGDFRELLKQNTDEIKRPPAMPSGSWYGLVTNQEFGESKEKKTPFTRYTVKVTAAGKDIDQSEDLSDFIGREMQKDFYITKDSLWRLSEFITSCKINATGRPLDETIPEVIGKEVLFQIVHERQAGSKPTDPPFSRIGDIAGRPEE